MNYNPISWPWKHAVNIKVIEPKTQAQIISELREFIRISVVARGDIPVDVRNGGRVLLRARDSSTPQEERSGG